jgi:hypothetical protein
MTTTVWTIPDLLQLSGGYWSVCALHAGVTLDLFSALDGPPLSAAEVAQLRNSNPRATAMLLDAMTALGLLVKSDTSYVCTPFAAAHLSKSSPGYMGHIIRHHQHLVAGWARLPEAVQSGGPLRKEDSHSTDEELRESFLMGMFNLASQLAPQITRAIDLSGCRTLLDLGGGPGTYAIHFCTDNPGLNSIIYDLPTTRSFAEQTVARYNLSDRIGFHAGNYHTDDLPEGCDAAWLSHILHIDGPRACAALLDKTVTALEPGGVLMIQEFILSDAKDGPLFPALFSLNMLLGTESGQSYSEGELSVLMKNSGLSNVQRLTLELPNGAGVLMGRKQ